MRFPRTPILILAAAAVLASTLTVVQEQPAEAGKRSCTGWTNRMVEPKRIRVLNTRTGRVHRPLFRRYVAMVMASGEWPSRLPYHTLVSGAFVTKQYAWYHSLRGHWRGGISRGRCYDVVNTTQDQLWRPGVKPTRKQRKALDAVWGMSAWKWNKSFFMPGYRAGTARICGSDANGWKLYARSATNCAKRGWSWKRILRRYLSKTTFRWNKQALARRE